MSPFTVLEVAQVSLNVCIIPIAMFMWTTSIKLAKVETDLANIKSQLDRLLNQTNRQRELFNVT